MRAAAGRIADVVRPRPCYLLSAEEIANATTALKTLDKNEDGKLSRDEMRPPRPGRGDGKGGAGDREGRGRRGDRRGPPGGPPPGGDPPGREEF